MKTWIDKCREVGQDCGCGEVCMFAPTDNTQAVIKQLQDDLVEQRNKYEQCLRDTKAWMERNYRVPSNYPVYKNICKLLGV